MFKIFKILMPTCFVISLGIFIYYSNYLALNRPVKSDIVNGFLYSYIGKGNIIYISIYDYIIILLSFSVFIMSAVYLNNIMKKK